jgi:hypothetical protein
MSDEIVIPCLVPVLTDTIDTPETPTPPEPETPAIDVLADVQLTYTVLEGHNALVVHTRADGSTEVVDINSDTLAAKLYHAYQEEVE